MTTNERFVLCTALGLLLVSSYSLAKTGDAQTAVVPNAKTTAIILDDKHWTIEDLDKLARHHIWGQVGPSAQEVRQVLVHVRPRDQTVMCEFTYSAGFGKQIWRVQIGYDGKVNRVIKGTKREG